MAVTLAQSAELSEDQLRRGVVEEFVQESVVLDRMPFMDINGNAYKYRKEDTLPGVAWRAVNGSYTESTGVVNSETESLYILGGDADVDRFIQQTRSNINDQRAVQTAAKVKAMNYAFQDAFINGDNDADANQIDGLKVRLTGGQVLTAATNGLGVVTAGHDFFDALDALLAAVKGGADALYMNALIRAKIRSSARRLGGWQTYKEIETGKIIESYNGVPLLDIGEKPDGSLIIPQTESCGTSNVTSSIYAVKWGFGEEADQAVTGITNGGIMVEDLGQLQEKPAYRTRVEAYLGMCLFGGKAAARLKGVLNS